MRVAWIDRPFSLERRVAEVPAGASVADIMRWLGMRPDAPARVFLSADSVIPARVSLSGAREESRLPARPASGILRAAGKQTRENDSQRPVLREVPDAARATTFPPAGSLLTIRVIPRGGNAGDKALQAVLQLVVLSAAAFADIATAGALTPVLGPGAGMILGAVAAGATSMAGNLAIRALIPPPRPPNAKPTTDPMTFSISGNQNLLAPFAPIPRIYGVRQVAPMMAAAPYTQNFGNDQYLRQLFVLGFGPIDIAALKIRDTLIDEFEDVQWEVMAGYPDDPPPQLYTGSVIEEDLSVLLAYAPNNNLKLYGWQKQTTGTQCDEISVDITFPDGLIAVAQDQRQPYLGAGLDSDPLRAHRHDQLGRAAQYRGQGEHQQHAALGRSVAGAARPVRRRSAGQRGDPVGARLEQPADLRLLLDGAPHDTPSPALCDGGTRDGRALHPGQQSVERRGRAAQLRGGIDPAGLQPEDRLVGRSRRKLELRLRQRWRRRLALRARFADPAYDERDHRAQLRPERDLRHRRRRVEYAGGHARGIFPSSRTRSRAPAGRCRTSTTARAISTPTPRAWRHGASTTSIPPDSSCTGRAWSISRSRTTPGRISTTTRSSLPDGGCRRSAPAARSITPPARSRSTSAWRRRKALRSSPPTRKP